MTVLAKYRVDIIESERGWGQRLEGSHYFDSREEAAAFVKEYNADNNLDVVPDWYMYATRPVLAEVEADENGSVV